jgi:hypothetical protein
MTVPAILALDFDGVLCDGMGEYFESSRRAYRRVWPDDPPPSEQMFPAFRTLRPVVTSGWEMPLVLRAIAQGRASAALHGWEAVRQELLASGAAGGGDLAAVLARALDDVRRDWIADAPEDWLARNVPYCELAELRRVVGEPQRTVVVTTKEGEFARAILERWEVAVAGVRGKETGIHKCDDLRALVAEHAASSGKRPTLWFVEDRLEALRHVATHRDLDDVELFLAAWGYNTPETRAAGDGGRVRLLQLDRFRRGPSTWIGPSERGARTTP